jgi:hypothetical protein
MRQIRRSIAGLFLSLLVGVVLLQQGCHQKATARENRTEAANPPGTAFVVVQHGANRIAAVWILREAPRFSDGHYYFTAASGMEVRLCTEKSNCPQKAHLVEYFPLIDAAAYHEYHSAVEVKTYEELYLSAPHRGP